MHGHFWHQFLIQFFLLFHMVPSVLLSIAAFFTIFWLVVILQQPIRFFEISGYWCYHREQNRGYLVKEHKKLCQKHVSKVTMHFVWGQLPRKQIVPLNSPCLQMDSFTPLLIASVFYTQLANWNVFVILKLVLFSLTATLNLGWYLKLLSRQSTIEVLMQ